MAKVPGLAPPGCLEGAKAHDPLLTRKKRVLRVKKGGEGEKIERRRW
jgi:hypothetical protein